MLLLRSLSHDIATMTTKPEPPAISSVPRLSSSVNSSSEPSPRTESPLFVRPDILFSPSRKRPSHPLEEDHEEKLSAQSSVPPRKSLVRKKTPPSSPFHGSSPPVRRRTLEAQSHMRSRYHHPYRKRAVPLPLELRFTTRTMGRSSHTDMTLEDVDKVCCRHTYGIVYSLNKQKTRDMIFYTVVCRSSPTKCL